MANSIVPYSLKIIADNGRGSVLVENISKIDSASPEKNKIRANFDSDNEVTVELGNMRSGFSNADVIEIRTSGVRSGNKTFVLDTKKSSKTINISQTGSDYSGNSVSL